jgi:hypothetical protein
MITSDPGKEINETSWQGANEIRTKLQDLSMEMRI